jgi:hypothetical protein
MISEKGSACVVCSQCVFARNDILFSASKKWEDTMENCLSVSIVLGVIVLLVFLAQ